MIPRISPGKTWAGVYGALVAVAIYALALLPFAKAADRARFSRDLGKAGLLA